MAERGRGYCGGRGGGRREDPLDDEGLHQRDLRDVKNDDLRREVRALRRCIARLEASRDGDFNCVVHYEDDDKNDNPIACAGGERRFRHRVADPGRDFGVQLEIPEFTGKILPVVEIEGPPVYNEYPDEGVEYNDDLSGAVHAASEYNDDLSGKVLDVEHCRELKMGSYDAICVGSPISCFDQFSLQVEIKLPLDANKFAFNGCGDYIKTGPNCTIDIMIFDMLLDKILKASKKSILADIVNTFVARFIFLAINRRVFKHRKKRLSMSRISRRMFRTAQLIQTRGRVFSNKGRMMQMRTNTDRNGCQNCYFILHVSFSYFYFI
ncbi:hypothetical protein CASFOL_017983 [Castilleja foliolosa]|uniref:Uncharacterized protein n=1 Tax=Castilleja foliolosa TaxID=1961234 RepID=A0ABD3D730_9LAMI